MFSVVLQLVSTLMHKWVKSTRSSNYLCLWELRINVSHLESWKIKLQVKSTSEKALLRVCWVLVYLTAEGIISIHLNIAHGAPRCSSTHFILLSHDIGSFVPDFAPLFSPGLEGSWVEKMLSMKKDKRDECNLNTHTQEVVFYFVALEFSLQHEARRGEKYWKMQSHTPKVGLFQCAGWDSRTEEKPLPSQTEISCCFWQQHPGWGEGRGQRRLLAAGWTAPKEETHTQINSTYMSNSPHMENLIKLTEV